MSDSPGTPAGESGKPSAVDWGHSAELHKKDDGGGLLYRFKTIRRGTIAELVDFVMDLPESEQGLYAIQKDGDHRMEIGEIRSLFRRSDFPGSDAA